MIRVAKKYPVQLVLTCILGLCLVLMASSLLPIESDLTAVDLLSKPSQEVEQTRSVSPESLILSAVKAIVHALLPVS